jgi:hypothetical protein
MTALGPSEGEGSPKPAADSVRPGKGSADPGAATSASPGRTRRRSRPRRRRKPPIPAELPLEQRYRIFVDSLPELSRNFLGLLEERGRLTPEEAQAALDIKTPKALGGLTGSIARWAPKRGVPVPFEAERGPGGGRVWHWALQLGKGESTR